MRRIALLLLLAGSVFGHPMGNLSVNRYARLEPSAKGVEVVYVLDVAEIPTFELMQTWGVAQGAPQGVLQAKAKAQAAEWVGKLEFLEDGKRLEGRLEDAELAVIDGAGNLPVFRITSRLHVAAKGGRFTFEDKNYPNRAGWREIVFRVGSGAVVKSATHSDQDISKGLTSYPQDPTNAPPQDSKAAFEWSIAKEPVGISSAAPVREKPVARAESAAPMVTAAQGSAGVRPPEQQAAGTIQRGDRMSQLLQTLRAKDLSWSILGLLLVLAFWFGALHALEPGHGKTMAAAYLVGERGTPKHALILGAAVTFTHTVSVFLLGLGTMFLSQYVMPDKITKWLGVVSGLSIVWIGGYMLWKRSQVLVRAVPGHDHSHAHPHPHPHPHEPGDLTHTHDGHTHSHVPEGELSMKSLIALGASGGLAPCPSALILLLSAISVGRPGLGVVLLISFSMGLAIVLTLTGLAVLYAKNLLPGGKRKNNVVFRWMPVVSAVAIVLVGVAMTGVSMGWLPVVRFFG